MNAADRIALQLGRLVINLENQADRIAALTAELKAKEAELAAFKAVAAPADKPAPAGGDGTAP
jgi:hypothetical protein